MCAKPLSGKLSGHSHRGLTKGPSRLWAEESCPGWTGGAPLMCVQPPDLYWRCFGRNGGASCTRPLFGDVLLCQESSSSTQLSAHQLLQATAPWGAERWAPTAWSWLMPLASCSSSQCPLLSSKVTQQLTAHFTGAYFLNQRHERGVLGRLCDFSIDMTVPA